MILRVYCIILTLKPTASVHPYFLFYNIGVSLHRLHQSIYNTHIDSQLQPLRASQVKLGCAYRRLASGCITGRSRETGCYIRELTIQLTEQKGWKMTVLVLFWTLGGGGANKNGVEKCASSRGRERAYWRDDRSWNGETYARHPHTQTHRHTHRHTDKL